MARVRRPFKDDWDDPYTAKPAGAVGHDWSGDAGDADARRGRALVLWSFIGLVICGVSPLGSALLVPLEDRFPAWTPTADAPDGIIVLGGAIHPDVSVGRGTAVADIGIDRVIKAVELARRYPQARIIHSSGSANLVGSDAREADYGLQTFSNLGISPDRITIERNSRNTVENAVYSKALANPKPRERWLLVTSAYHMPAIRRSFSQGRLSG